MNGNRLLTLWRAQWNEALRSGGGFFMTWRIVTFALVMLGFLALAFTGELHPLVMLGFVLSWGVAFFCLQTPEWWREWMSRLVVWALLALIGVVAVQGKFSSVLYLLLFLALYKCFTLREPSDHLHALLMSFFMFLACTIITTSMSYLAFMLLFVVLLMLDLICWTIAREGNRALTGGFTPDNPAINYGTASGRPVMARLFYSSMMTGLIVLALTFGLFLVVPHYSSYKVPNPWAKAKVEESTVSGYSDEMTFGTLDRLNLDDTKVMDVRVAWADQADRALPSALRLRGMVLDEYSEQRWDHRALTPEKDSSNWHEINFPPLTVLRGLPLVQQIRQHSMMTRRLFGASAARHYQLEFNPQQGKHYNWPAPLLPGQIPTGRIRLDYRTQTLQVLDAGMGLNSMNEQLRYTVKSEMVEEATPLLRRLARQNEARSASPSSSQAAAHKEQPASGLHLHKIDRLINTQLPYSNQSLLLMRIVKERSPAPDIPGKLVQLMDWFQCDFEYSLSPKTPRGMNPIDAFLTRTHKGHCEYFATAFVLLARAQGIPARVATGFFTNEWNSQDQAFIVRQSDAHAWAEVWLDDYGWLTLDPTPTDWRGRVSRLTDPGLSWNRFIGMMRGYWQRYVLDYSATQQQRILRDVAATRIVQRTKFLVTSLVETGKSLIENRPKSLPSIHWNAERVQFNLILLLTVVLLIVLLVLQYGSRFRAGGGSSSSPVIFMNALIQRLQALGWKRKASQTPAELITKVEHETQGRLQLQWILDLYHRYRFGRTAPSAEEESRVQDAIRKLK